jgi:predicted transcriptional regulator of viral defense system
MEMEQHNSQILDFAKQRGLFKAKDIEALGIPRQTISRLVNRGELHSVGRGVFIHPDYDYGEYFDFARVAMMAPKCVICLFSALRFHEMTTESTREIWLAHARGDRPPKIDEPRVTMVTFSKQNISLSIEKHNIDGAPVKITSAVKTVVDCFKYRNKIGLNIALDALRAYMLRTDCDVDELWRLADACQMSAVMRPYLEAME